METTKMDPLKVQVTVDGQHDAQGDFGSSDTDHLNRKEGKNVALMTFFVYLGWILLGVFTGAHWGVLGCLAQAGDRVRPLVHMGLTWLGWVIFIGFRWPLPDWSEDCPDNSTMSRECLFDHQSERYAAFYTIHIIILVFMFVVFFVDGAQLWRWVPQTLQNRKRTFCCCTPVSYLWSYALAGVITLAIVIAWSQVHWRAG